MDKGTVTSLVTILCKFAPCPTPYSASALRLYLIISVGMLNNAVLLIKLIFIIYFSNYYFKFTVI